MLRLFSVGVLLLLAGCAYQTSTSLDWPDRSVTVVKTAKTFDPFQIDTSMTLAKDCHNDAVGTHCQMLDVSHAAQRGLGGAILEGSGPAALIGWGLRGSGSTTNVTDQAYGGAGGAATAGATGGSAAALAQQEQAQAQLQLQRQQQISLQEQHVNILGEHGYKKWPHKDP